MTEDHMMIQAGRDFSKCLVQPPAQSLLLPPTEYCLFALELCLEFHV